MSTNPFETEEGFVLFHTIEISIGVKEKDLTDEQRNVCITADSHPEVDHPMEWGCETLAEAIEGMASGHFNYLMKGSKAVKICIDNGLTL